MKKLIFLLLMIIALTNTVRAQTFYRVDSSEQVGELSVNAIGSAQAAPFWIHVTTNTGGYFARIGVPLLILLRDTANDSSFYQAFELDSVTQVVGDSLYVVKRALSNSKKLYWAPGTLVQVVNNDGIIIKQLQLRIGTLSGLPDTTGHAGQFLKDSGSGVGPVWSTVTSGGAGVTSFNTRTGVVAPASGDYAFGQINGTAAVTQGGTGLSSIVANKLIYSSANNVFSPLSLGTGLSITSGTLNVSGFQASLPDTTGYTNYALVVLPTGVLGWAPQGTGTVTSINVDGGGSGIQFGHGPIVNTGTISITGGQLGIAYGGTGGATKEQAQANILPDSTGHTKQFLEVDSAGGFVWKATGAGSGGSGTVTSVNVAIGGMTSSGAITTSGTITMSGALAIANGGTALTSTPTDGQLLIGKTATSKYVQAALTGTANEVVVTNGSGSITLSTPQPIATTSDVTFDSLTLTKALPVTSGGMGATTLTAHGLLVGEGTTPVVDLGAATNGQIPIGSTGADPVLAALTGTSNEITVTNGAGSITLATPQAIATGSSPTFAALTLTAPLTYANGGTGQSTYAKGDILYASATNTISKLAIGSTNNVLSVVSGVPAWTAAADTARSAGTSAIALLADSAIVVNHLDVLDSAKKVSHLDVLDSAIRAGSAASADTAKKAPVMSVSNSDGTITISPTTGIVVASLALGHSNTWTAAQTFHTPVNINSASGVYQINGSDFLTDYGIANSVFVGGAGDAGGSQSDNTAVGYNSATHVTSAFGSTAVGSIALTADTSGSYNTAVGRAALFAITSGSSNTAIGAAALQSLKTGNYTVGLGFEAGLNSISTSLSHVLLVGGNGASGHGITKSYWGDGDVQYDGATPDNFEFHGTGYYTGSTSDTAQGSGTLSFYPGAPTIGANSGVGLLKFYSYAAGGTRGNTAASATLTATVDSNGIDAASGMSYLINHTTVLSSTQVLGGPNVTANVASNPAGTSSATTKMMGFAISFTPSASGTVQFMISGNIQPGATGNPTAQIFYGTGTAPTNGHAVTGTPVGSVATITGLASGSAFITLVGTATGLIPSTTYWFDLGLSSDGTSTANFTSPYLQAYELK